MKIRLPVLVLVPLIGVLLACWWLLSRELVLLLPFRGNLYTTLRLTLFVAPFYILWRSAND